MDFAVPAAITLGFVTGLRHAFDPDHVCAVTALANQNRDLLSSIMLGVAWGAGHATIVIVAIVLLDLLQFTLPPDFFWYAEIGVGVMLVLLGFWAIRISLVSTPGHTGSYGNHGKARPRHRSKTVSYLIGLIHGLAGSGAIIVVVAASLATFSQRLTYAIVFGAGSLIGMGLVSAAVSLPFIAASKSRRTINTLTRIAGMLSILVGAVMLILLTKGSAITI